MIPGAEHAPVVAVNLFRQPHISTPDDEAIAAFAQHERYAPGEPLLWRAGFDRVLHIVPHPTTVRRLTVTDPDDQRVIWRLAALHLGASEVEATRAVMLLTHHCRQLCIARHDGRRWLWSAPPETSWSVEYATAALCAAVWGPV